MDIEDISRELWKSPTSANWEKLSRSLPRSGIKFYRVVYQKGKIANKEDLRDSYVELYDSKERMVTKVPVFKREGKGIRGATIYLKGLLNTNK